MARLLLCLWLCAGCVSATWRRESRYEPAAQEAIAGLAAQESDLDDCLQAFGAPLWVWEQGQGEQAGAVLAYGWYDGRGWELRASVPVSEYASAALDYEQIDARMRGLVLFFDQDWKLTAWRTGLLRDLSRELRRPPSDITEDA